MFIITGGGLWLIQWFGLKRFKEYILYKSLLKQDLLTLLLTQSLEYDISDLKKEFNQ